MSGAAKPRIPELAEIPVKERNGTVELLLTAADSDGSDGAKLGRMAPARGRIRVLRAAEMGRALGRPMAVHVALAPGRLTRKLEREAARLSGFRGE